MIPRTLALFAHPDDETFGPGATLAALGERGPSALLCCTRGEAGSIDQSAKIGKSKLAKIREEELLAASDILGFDSVEILNLPDSGLRWLEPETIVLPFVRAIRSFKPHIVLTFHENGISRHRDHRTVTRRVGEAVTLAADGNAFAYLGKPHQVGRVWWYSIPDSKAAQFENYRSLASVPDADIQVTIDLRSHVRKKWAAVDAHATQKLFVENMAKFLGERMENYWAFESFVLAQGEPPSTDGRVESLYEGLEEATT